MTDKLQLKQLVELAFQYGPFLFALLFTIYGCRWTQGKWNQAILRKDPAAAAEEIRTLRWTFIATALIGVALVAVSVVWWIKYRPIAYMFRGEILDLKEYEKIVSKDLYFRARRLDQLRPDLPQIRDEEFVVIQDTPFKDRQTFLLHYAKGQGDPNSFEIQYVASESARSYKVVWDDKAQRTVLKEASAAAPAGSTFLSFPSAHAAEAQPATLAQAGPATAAAPRTAPSESGIVAALQDERTDVGSKIRALDQLAGLDDPSLRRIAEKTTKKEPVVLTLIDLSRHTDPELASKARRIVARVNADDMFVQKLLSASDKTSRDTETMLYRLEPQQAMRILRTASGAQPQKFQRLSAEISSGQASKVLIPTGTSQGDRYYVKAAWDPKKSATVDCLTRLFNSELLGRPGLQQEAAFMQQRSERYVYWYEKEWALSISGKIQGCGARATFVALAQ